VIVDLNQVRDRARERKRRQRHRDREAWSRGEMPGTKEGRTRPPSVTKSVTNVTKWPRITTLSVAAFGLLVTGLGINAMTAWSQGASDWSRPFYFILGIAADLASYVLPSRASILWQQGRQSYSIVAWFMYLFVLAFSLLASTGFAAFNLTETAAVRAERITPASENAQRLADRIAKSRGDECKRRGDRCRELEAQERNVIADVKAAWDKVAAEADPQVTKTAALIGWITLGRVKPDAEDIANARLVLMTLLPQFGGLLRLVARR
jgi:hypothetical protein